MKRLILMIAVLGLLIVLTAPAYSAEKGGITLPDSEMVDGNSLVLNGLALREKFVFDVYVAGLYLKEKSHDAESILSKDESRMMIMHFLRDVSAKKINSAWYEGLEANTTSVTPELKAKFDQLADMMRDIKEGEVMGFSYTPVTGTAVMVAGQSMGAIPGKDFADAILATWIGPKPGPGNTFKKDLLGE